MGLFDLLGSGSTDALEHVIGFTTQRHKVFAHNLANIDTPGYRMRDLDSSKFDQAMAQAFRKAERTNANMPRLGLPSVQELDAPPDGRRLATTIGPAENLRGIVFHDDNDRSIEKVMVEMTKNADRHSQASNLLRSQIRLLRSIIAESAQ